MPLNVPVLSEGDGFYGWYAIAAQRPEDLAGDKFDDDDYCLSLDHVFLPDCDYQSPEGSGGANNVSLPAAGVRAHRLGHRRADVRHAVDEPRAERLRRLPGQLAVFARAQGAPEGAGQRRHVWRRHRHLHRLGQRPRRAGLHARGVRRPRRRRRRRPEERRHAPRGPRGRPRRRPDRQCAQPLRTSRAGSRTRRSRPSRRSRSARAAAAPTAGARRSRRSRRPGSDPNPSSGYNAGALTVLVDEAGNDCGAAAGGSSGGPGATAITCPAGTVAVTQEGRHVISAFSTDRLGNESPRADIKDDEGRQHAAAVGHRARAAQARRRRDPRHELVPHAAVLRLRGARQGRRLRASTDRSRRPGSSTPSTAGRPEATRRRTSRCLTRTPTCASTNGVHDICWFAVDVAGNKEAGGDPRNNDAAGNCQFAIKVDDVAPGDRQPDQPGRAGRLATASTSRRRRSAARRRTRRPASLASSSRSTRATGSPGAPAPIAEGVHTVRTRSFDVAGNPSQILERRVFVDRSDPSAKLVAFPPAPNSRGWYRRTLKDSIATSDGRDGSGPDVATFSVNGGGPTTYLAPFDVGHGVNSVGVRARDVAGRQGALVSQTQKVDTVAPAGAPVGQTTILTLPAHRAAQPGRAEVLGDQRAGRAGARPGLHPQHARRRRAAGWTPAGSRRATGSSAGTDATTPTRACCPAPTRTASTSPTRRATPCSRRRASRSSSYSGCCRAGLDARSAA